MVKGQGSSQSYYQMTNKFIQNGVKRAQARSCEGLGK